VTFEAGAGGGLELGPISLKALADLQVGLDSVAGQLAAVQQRELDYQKYGPIFIQMIGAGTVDASGDPLYMDLGGPNQGRAWEVRQIVIGGMTWATVVGGNASILVQPNSPSPLAPAGIGSTQDHATALPSVAFYSAGQFRVKHPSHVFIAVLSGTASTAYQAIGDAYDVPDVPTRDVFTV
jgi:hypothetical protein